jgi:hypothetical protein
MISCGASWLCRWVVVLGAGPLCMYSLLLRGVPDALRVAAAAYACEQVAQYVQSCWFN